MRLRLHPGREPHHAARTCPDVRLLRRRTRFPKAPIDEEESGCGCSSCGCHSHEHDHDHGSGDDKRELLLMGVSAVLFADRYAR